MHISIVIPVYNSERYIARCLSSVLKQSFTDYQVIVVNDGSYDKSAEIIQGFAKKYPKITVCEQEHRGPAHARNFGVRKSIGDYITFIDIDDVISPNYLAKLAECANKTNAEVVISGYTIVRKNGVYKRIKPTKYEAGKNESWAYQCCSTWGRLYKKDFWDKYKLTFSEQRGIIGEELPQVFFSNAMANNICVSTSTGYCHSLHNDSIMHRSKEQNTCIFPYDGMKSIHKALKKLKMTNSRDYYNIGLLKLFANFIYVLCASNQKEKVKLINYLARVYGDDFDNMIASWKRLRCSTSFKWRQKAAIQVLIMQYGNRIKTQDKK